MKTTTCDMCGTVITNDNKLGQHTYIRLQYEERVVVGKGTGPNGTDITQNAKMFFGIAPTLHNSNADICTNCAGKMLVKAVNAARLEIAGEIQTEEA